MEEGVLIVSVDGGCPGVLNVQDGVIGATAQPASLPYRANMSVLDAMIAVGGLNEFAAGNRAKLIRLDRETGKQEEFRLRLSDLIRRGDASAKHFRRGVLYPWVLMLCAQ